MAAEFGIHFLEFGCAGTVAVHHPVEIVDYIIVHIRQN